MNKLISTLLTTLFAIVVTNAQQISVVSENGATTLHRTLQEAIEEADPGSVIYLPGGGFQISEEVKITKKLTFMGISHRGNTSNADGATIILGNLTFTGESSGSAVLGLYIFGDVIIGEDNVSVNNILVRKCNVNSIQVKNSTCTGVDINQNYIRSSSNFGGCNAKVTNNVSRVIENITGGNILHNIFIGNFYHGEGYGSYTIGIQGINASIVSGNIFQTSIHFYHGWCYSTHSGVPNCTGNMNAGGGWGDNPISFDVGLEELFINWNNGEISPFSNFHFKDEYKQQYEDIVGIYAGSGFDDNQIAPVPYIVAKRVDEETDASGMLNIKIRVKAGE